MSAILESLPPIITYCLKHSGIICDASFGAFDASQIEAALFPAIASQIKNIAKSGNSVPVCPALRSEAQLLLGQYCHGESGEFNLPLVLKLVITNAHQQAKAATNPEAAAIHNELKNWEGKLKRSVEKRVKSEVFDKFLNKPYQVALLSNGRAYAKCAICEDSHPIDDATQDHSFIKGLKALHAGNYYKHIDACVCELMARIQRKDPSQSENEVLAIYRREKAEKRGTPI